MTPSSSPCFSSLIPSRRRIPLPDVHTSCGLWPDDSRTPRVHFLQVSFSYFDPLHPSWPETDQQLLLPSGQSPPLTSSVVSFVQWVDQQHPHPSPTSYSILEILVSLPCRSIPCEKQETRSTVSVPLWCLRSTYPSISQSRAWRVLELTGLICFDHE